MAEIGELSLFAEINGVAGRNGSRQRVRQRDGGSRLADHIGIDRHPGMPNPMPRRGGEQRRRCERKRCPGCRRDGRREHDVGRIDDRTPVRREWRPHATRQRGRADQHAVIIDRAAVRIVFASGDREVVGIDAEIVAAQQALAEYQICKLRDRVRVVAHPATVAGSAAARATVPNHHVVEMNVIRLGPEHGHVVAGVFDANRGRRIVEYIAKGQRPVERAQLPDRDIACR